MNKKTTVELVQGVSSQIESTIESCSSATKRVAIEKSLSALKVSLSETLEYLNANEKRKFVAVRKWLRAVYNIVDGALEGVSSHELTKGEFRGILNTLKTRFYPMVCSSLSHEIEKAEQAPAITLSADQEQVKLEIAQAADFKDALKAVKKVVNEAEHAQTGSVLGQNDEATIKQLKELADMRKNLPLQVKTDFTVVRMPVVPIFSNYQMNSAATFAKLGIKHVLVEGYAVLLNQLLIAVSERRAKKSGMEPKQFAEAAVSLMNERGSVEYEFVTDEYRVNPRNTDIQLFWLMPRPKLAALMRIALTGRKASTLKWDFPM